MYGQASLYFYRFRFVFASLLTIAFLLFISALVAAVGSGTVLDTRAPSIGVTDSGVSDAPNAVTAGAASLADGTQRFLLATGRGLYGSCRSVTIATAQSGRSVAHGSAVIVGGAWHGVASVVRGAGSSVMFVLRIPGRAVGSVTDGHAVSAVIRPTDDKPVPVISSETSAEALAHLSAAQQQEVAQWQAAQLAANQALEGVIIAGDPNHGGYPAKWDNARQDSMVDNWGMYSRECVSYAAWKVYQTYGDMPYWGGVGNANQWVRDARNAGIPTGSTPRVHSVAISMNGYYGHAMWVERVSGNMIYVSQYNYDLHGHYSEMWVEGNSFTYIYFK